VSTLSKLPRIFLSLLVVASSLAFASISARADFINGHALRLYCSSQNPSDDAICLVYITGAVDAFTTVDLIGEKTNGTKRLFCLPDNSGPETLREMTMEWMERPETNLDFAATLIIWGALKERCSCP